MKVKELIELLKEQNPDATVWVDWDQEGGNVVEVQDIENLDFPSDGSAIILK
jgi:hypothetical protein